MNFCFKDRKELKDVVPWDKDPKDDPSVVLFYDKADQQVCVSHEIHDDLRYRIEGDKIDTAADLDRGAAVQVTQDWSAEGGELQPVSDSKRREVWTHHMVGIFYQARATSLRVHSGESFF